MLADKRIQPGEKVLTAGGDQIFPRGLPVGVVDKVVPDPDRDGFIDVIVKPAAHLDRLDEVLVITSTEPRFSPDQQQDIWPPARRSKVLKRNNRRGIGRDGRAAARPASIPTSPRSAAAARHLEPQSGGAPAAGAAP